jgi:hypothetical protein
MLELLASVLATVVAWFLPSTLTQANIVRILIVSISITIFFLFVGTYFVPGGANQFTVWAEALINGSKLDPHYAQRDVGYPLILLISGYPFTGSFIGVTLIQASCSILMPVLVFRALQPFSLGVAYYAGQVSNFSFAPIWYMKMIHHDHVYIFCTILMMALLICFITTRLYKYLYLFTTATIFASISRPAGNLLFPVFLLFAWILDRRGARHYLACLAAFGLAMGVYQWHRYEIFDMKNQQTMPSYTGQQIFYNLYINSREYGIHLSPDLGPSMQKLGESLRVALTANPPSSKFFRDHVDSVGMPVAKMLLLPFNTEELVERAYLSPNFQYYTLFCDAEANDQVFLGAAAEIAKTYPSLVVRYALRNLILYVLYPGFTHPTHGIGPISSIGLMFYPLRAGFSEQPYIDARAVREAQVRLTTSPALAHASEALESFWLNNFHPFLRVTLLLSLVAWLATILFAVSSATNTWKAQFIAPFPEPGFFASLTVVSLLFLYNAVVTALFAEPDYRYQHFIVLLRILLAGFGTIVLARLFELRSTLDTSFIKNVRAGLKAIQSRDLLVRSLQYRVPRVFVLLFCITCALFAWWGYVMYASAGTPATHGLISP